MIGLLLQCLVVFCGIYCVLWVVAFVLGFFVPAVKANAWYPLGGPNAVGSWVTFAVALTIWIVFGHHSVGAL